MDFPRGTKKIGVVGAPERAIVLISADAADFYAKPTLSNALAQKRTAAQLVTTPAAQMAQTAQVQLHAHCTVRRLDTATPCHGERLLEALY